MLTVQDNRIVIITLEGLENILRVGQKDIVANGGVNPFSILIEEAYGKQTFTEHTSGGRRVKLETRRFGGGGTQFTPHRTLNHKKIRDIFQREGKIVANAPPPQKKETPVK